MWCVVFRVSLYWVVHSPLWRIVHINSLHYFICKEKRSAVLYLFHQCRGNVVSIALSRSCKTWHPHHCCSFFSPSNQLGEFAFELFSNLELRNTEGFQEKDPFHSKICIYNKVIDHVNCFKMSWLLYHKNEKILVRKLQIYNRAMEIINQVF